MDLSYFNARIRAMMGALLKENDYAPLFAVEGVTGFVDRLRGTAYGPYVETAGVHFQMAEDIFSAALADDLADTFAKLWGIAPEEATPFLKAILSEWEVFDLKAVIRGVARSIRKSEVQGATIPAGEFDIAAIRTLLTAEDVLGVIRFLDTWGSPYAEPLKAGLPHYRKNGGTGEMEIHIDRFIFPFLFKIIKDGSLNHRIMFGVLALRIDIRNIMTLFKIVGEGYTEEGVLAFFIEGGKGILQKDFLVLAKLNDREVLAKRLVPLIKDGGLKDVLASSDPNETYSFEERLDEIVEKKLKRLSVVEPLSIAPAASYIHMKVREIKNLRLIGRSKAFGIPEDEIKRFITYPV